MISAEPASAVCDNLVPSRRASRLLIAMFALLVLLYAWIIYMTSVGDIWWELDVVNSFRMWGVDDSYRFYIIRDAFNHASYFSWSYTLPLQLFFDGGLAVILSDNIAVLRAIHGGIYLLSLFFLAHSLLRLSPRWPLAWSAVLMLGLIPFCLFISISFYAEAYMMSFVVLMLVARINQRDNLLLVLAAISPLTRPEGIFFLGAVGLYFLVKKDLKRALLAGMPIGVFFAWMLSTSGWTQFVEWREHFGQVQSVIREIVPEQTNVHNVWKMFGGWLLLPVLLSLFNSKLRPLWPLLLATGLWFVYWTLNIIVGGGNYEARYFVPVVPVLVVMWALGLDWLYTLLSGYPGRRVAASGCALLFAATLSFFVLQQTHIRFYLEQRFTEDPLPLASLAQMPLRTTPETVRSRQGLMRAIYHAVSEENPYQVDRLLFSSSFARLYYYMDPEKVPRNVMVGFAPTRSDDLIYKTPNRVFAMFGSPNRYAYFDFFPPELGGPLAVFVGNIEHVAPIRIYGDVPLYLFRYQSYQ